MKSQGRALYPFVPSGPSLATALEFFAAIGFQVQWQQEGLAGLRFGAAYFILQEIDVPEWQKNQMITVEIDDLELYWSEISEQKLPERFSGVRLRPPTDFAWGREIHIVDPAGVCWHVRQAASRP
jgi:hypothetical protein